MSLLINAWNEEVGIVKPFNRYFLVIMKMLMRILNHGYKTRCAVNAVTYTEGPWQWRCFVA